MSADEGREPESPQPPGVEEAPRAASSGGPDEPQVLLVGVGNVFHGDDGFGVAVAQRLLQAPPPPGVRVLELGIRSYDLALALTRVRAAVIVDAYHREGALPGTLVVLETEEVESSLDVANGHNLNPAQALELARALGGAPQRVLVVGCQPATLQPDPDLQLSAAVQAAVEPAAARALELAQELSRALEAARA